MTEAQIEGRVVGLAKKKGWLSIKLSGANDRGKPDRMFLRDSKTAFIEFKAPGKLPTLLQQKWIADLRKAGFRATWINNYDDGKRFFESFDL